MDAVRKASVLCLAVEKNKRERDGTFMGVQLIAMKSNSQRQRGPHVRYYFFIIAGNEMLDRREEAGRPTQLYMPPEE